jgi:hypothetical protein
MTEVNDWDVANIGSAIYSLCPFQEEATLGLESYDRRGQPNARWKKS